MNKTNRRDFLSALAAGGGAALAMAGRHSLLHGAGRNGGKPNVIVFLVDDMGWIDSATYGSKYYQTPNMTRLAKRGMLFTDGYAASPLCSPTRASIMSGQHPARLRMTVAITPKSVPEPKALPPQPNRYCGRVQGRDRLPGSVYSLAEALKDSGYHTAHIGKWHLTHRNIKKCNAEDQGFDYVIGGKHLPGPPDYYSPYKNRIHNLKPGPEGEYLNERLAEEGVKWISSVKKSRKPFFLNFWHYAVHTPIIPKRDLMPKYTKRRDPKSVQRCPEMATMLESMDTSLGILLDYLDRPENRELKANTLLIFTSDNGGLIHKKVKDNQVTSNRPLRGGKGNTYEGGIREPWIVSWPAAVKPGTVCRTPVQTIDIYPTVLEAAGIKVRASHVIDGQSILPLLRGKAMDHQPIFTDFPHIFGILCAPSACVRVGDYKLIRFFHAGKDKKSHYYELFDLKRDRYESINLAGYMPAKVRELDRLIEKHLKDTDALVPIRNGSFAGNPRKPRAKGKKAANRPKKLQLSETAISGAAAGKRRVKLLDEKGKTRKANALALAGSSRVRIKRLSDGSVELTWTPVGKAGARILFGWRGGISPHEMNDWTFNPCELVLKG